MNLFGQEFTDGLNQDQLLLIGVIAIWELIWKGFALWRAARNKDTFWFVLLLAINSAGLLPAIYIFYLSKKPTNKKRVIKLKIPANIAKKSKEEDSKEEKSSKKKSKGE